MDRDVTDTFVAPSGLADDVTSGTLPSTSDEKIFVVQDGGLRALATVVPSSITANNFIFIYFLLQLVQTRVFAVQQPASMSVHFDPRLPPTSPVLPTYPRVGPPRSFRSLPLHSILPPFLPPPLPLS